MRCLIHLHVHLQCQTPEFTAWCSRCASEIMCRVTNHKHDHAFWIEYAGIITRYAWHPHLDIVLCERCLSADDDSACNVYDTSDILAKWKKDQEEADAADDYWHSRIYQHW